VEHYGFRVCAAIGSEQDLYSIQAIVVRLECLAHVAPSGYFARRHSARMGLGGVDKAAGSQHKRQQQRAPDCFPAQVLLLIVY
jgi:hypothetical protein